MCVCVCVSHLYVCLHEYVFLYLCVCVCVWVCSGRGCEEFVLGLALAAREQAGRRLIHTEPVGAAPVPEPRAGRGWKEGWREGGREAGLGEEVRAPFGQPCGGAAAPRAGALGRPGWTGTARGIVWLHQARYPAGPKEHTHTQAYTRTDTH